MDYVFKKEDIEAFVKSELEALQVRIAANIGSTGRTASGRTAKSMEVETIPWGGRLTGRAAFGTLETGRKPGKVPANFTAIIRQWIKDKGLRTTPIPYKRKPSDKWQPKYTPAERGELSLAGAIAYKIRTEGTRLYRTGGDGDVYSNEIPAAVEKLRAGILQMMTMTIKNIPNNENRTNR